MYLSGLLAAACLTLFGMGAHTLPGVVRNWHGDTDRHRTTPLAIALIAIGLRLFLAPMMPEIRWRLGWSYQDDWLFHAGDSSKYGLGMPWIVHQAVRVVGPLYETPFVLNAIIGGLTVLPLAGWVRSITGEARAGRWAAAPLAITPCGCGSPRPPRSSSCRCAPKRPPSLCLRWPSRSHPACAGDAGRCGWRSSAPSSCSSPMCG